MKFLELAKCFENLEKTSKRLEKIEIIKEVLKKTNKDQYEYVLLLLEGRIFPLWSQKKLGIASKMAIKAISKSFGINSQKIEKDFVNQGDLGLSAQKFISKKQQSSLDSFWNNNDQEEKENSLTVKKVFENFKKIASIEGEKSVDQKIQLISELLNKAKDLEAKYIIRIALEDLRIGVAFGTLRDALILAIFPKIIGLSDKKELELDNSDFKGEILKITKEEQIEEIKLMNLTEFNFIKARSYEEARIIQKIIIKIFNNAHEKINETYKIAIIAKEEGLKGLKNVKLEVLTPIKAMLMQKVESVEEAIKKIDLPFALEYKYDGFRTQCHKKGDVVKLYTRNLEDVTNQFPDIVKIIKENVKVNEIILDGEILAIDKDNKFLPFQNISQRIKRKHNIEKIVKDIPAIYATWDVLYLNEKSTIDKPLRERRNLLLKSISQDKTKIIVSEQLTVTSIETGNSFYAQSLKEGNEGIVVKDLNAKYQPGNRVGCWLKIKPIMDPLDLVVVGAEWGEGKRAKWLTSFKVACRDELTDEFLSIGKVGTGFKEINDENNPSEDVSFDKMTNLLKPLIINSKGSNSNSKIVEIKPKIVIEIAYEEIQKSPTYTSGFALRFPRILRLRKELDSRETDDLNKIQDYFNQQKYN